MSADSAATPNEAEERDNVTDALRVLADSGILGVPEDQESAELAEADLDDTSSDPTMLLKAAVELEEDMARVYQEIVSRAPEHDVQPSVQRVVDALELLGNPQNSYRVIHLTGTNGKTSTARMIEALVRERGLRTGRYTSPHLSSIRERISVDGEPVSRDVFLDTYAQIKPVIDMVDAASAQAGGPRMSFFEVLTVMAYAAFADAPVDVAIIEVGMGGQWDATNVVDADVAVLTTVDMDHERWLGSDRTAIAAEKLGIVSPGTTLVCANQHDDVLPLVAERVLEQRSHLLYEGRDFYLEDRAPGVGGQLISIHTPAARYDDVPLALLGAHQARNASLALTAVEAFFGGSALAGDVVEHAFMSITSPGRLEVVRTSPTVIVDAAHNPAGAEAAMAAISDTFPGVVTAVVAMMADKDVEGYLGVLEPFVRHIVVTGMDSPRAMDSMELREIAEDVFGEDRVREEASLLSAIDVATGLAEAENREELTSPVTVVMGSVVVVAKTRELMGKAEPAV